MKAQEGLITRPDCLLLWHSQSSHSVVSFLLSLFFGADIVDTMAFNCAHGTWQFLFSQVLSIHRLFFGADTHYSLDDTTVLR